MKGDLAIAVRMAGVETVQRAGMPGAVLGVLYGVLLFSGPALLALGTITGAWVPVLMGSLVVLFAAPSLGLSTGQENPFLRVRVPSMRTFVTVRWLWRAPWFLATVGAVFGCTWHYSGRPWSAFGVAGTVLLAATVGGLLRSLLHRRIWLYAVLVPLVFVVVPCAPFLLATDLAGGWLAPLSILVWALAGLSLGCQLRIVAEPETGLPKAGWTWWATAAPAAPVPRYHEERGYIAALGVRLRAGFRRPKAAFGNGCILCFFPLATTVAVLVPRIAMFEWILFAGLFGSFGRGERLPEVLPAPSPDERTFLFGVPLRVSLRGVLGARILGLLLPSLLVGGTLVASGVGSPLALAGVASVLLLHAGETATWGLPIPNALRTGFGGFAAMIALTAAAPFGGDPRRIEPILLLFPAVPAIAGLLGILIVLFSLPEKTLVERMRRRT